MGELLSARWARGETEKEPFLRRARMFAAVTLPYLSPDVSGASMGDDLPVPTNSIGARGVSNLASKLTLSLFPPQVPFFQYELSPLEFADAVGIPADPSDPDFARAVTNAQLVLNRREREIQRALDTTGWRARAFESFLHLITGGSYLFRLGKGGAATGFRLDQHNVERDADGLPQWILVRESIHRDKLPPSIRAKAIADHTTAPRPSGREEVDLFTACERLPDGRWRTWQEAADLLVPRSTKVLSEDDLPWLPVRFIPDSNEDYGRSFADLVLGDLRTNEGLNQALIDVAALAAQVIFFVDPSMPVTPTRIAEAETGDYLPGNGDLVKPMVLDKLADMTIASNVKAGVQSGLELSFLLRSAVRRDGERVTAEEIRQIAQELDESLGGVFGLLAVEFQAPLVRKLEVILEREGALMELPKKTARVKITTGMDALGRGRDALALRSYLADVQAVFGDQAAKVIVAEEYLRRLALSQGIDPTGLIRSSEEIEQMNQQEQMAAFANRVGPEGVKLIGQQMAANQAGAPAQQ